MTSEVRILLTSDNHLGIKKSDIEISKEVRISTFQKICAIAKDYDILLIAGDLIDNINVESYIVDVIRYEFKQLKDNNTEIIYTPGLGEVGSDGTVWPGIYTIHASHIFSDSKTSKPFMYTKDDQVIYFYGATVNNGYDISKIKKASKNGCHIGLFHVDFNLGSDDKNSSVYKLNKNDMKTLNLDFYAFGHFHNFKMFKVLDKIIAAYAGTPEATKIDELGDRYIISLLVKDDKIQSIRRLTVNNIKVAETTIDCSQYNSFDSLLKELRNNVSRKVYSKLILKGERSFKLDQAKLKAVSAEFYGLKCFDFSSPVLSLLFDEFGQEDSMRGEFFRILKEKYENNEIPKNISWDRVSVILNLLIEGNHDVLEDWLCSI